MLGGRRPFFQVELKDQLFVVDAPPLVEADPPVDEPLLAVLPVAVLPAAPLLLLLLPEVEPAVPPMPVPPCCIACDEVLPP